MKYSIKLNAVNNPDKNVKAFATDNIRGKQGCRKCGGAGVSCGSNTF